jgi:hypothetical protein
MIAPPASILIVAEEGLIIMRLHVLELVLNFRGCGTFWYRCAAVRRARPMPTSKPANSATCITGWAALQCFQIDDDDDDRQTDRPNSVPKESPKVSRKGNQSLVFLQPIIVWIRGPFLHFPTLDSKILTYLAQPRVPPFLTAQKLWPVKEKKQRWKELQVQNSQESIKKEMRVRTNRWTHERCGLRHVDLLHTISAVLDQLHVVPPFLGSFVVLVLLLVAHYGKAMEILQRKSTWTTGIKLFCLFLWCAESKKKAAAHNETRNPRNPSLRWPLLFIIPARLLSPHPRLWQSIPGALSCALPSARMCVSPSSSAYELSRTEKGRSGPRSVLTPGPPPTPFIPNALGEPGT